VWLKLKIRLQQRVEVLNTADKLSAAMKDIWENLTVDYIQGLYRRPLEAIYMVLFLVVLNVVCPMYGSVVVLK
jgi:hypothetical protein